MLLELHIEDLGVISSLDLVVGPGLTVFTGETGAGKTMLVEAISLLVGGRADATMVRAGATEARVEGRFLDGDDEIVLARVIPVDGRSRAYVNGRLATVSTLAEHGVRLVDIHGQHAHQSLLGTAAQRAALDRFASVDLEPLRRARARLTEIDAALAALGGDVRTRAREIDLLRFQIDELDAAELTDADEDERLEELEDVLSGAQAHREAASVAVDALTSDAGALDAVRSAIAALGGRGPFAELAGRLRAVAVEVDDVAAEVRRLVESIDDDPARLAEVTERRQLLRNLRRKYGDTLGEVIEFRQRTRERLDELEGYDQAVDRLEHERRVALDDERAAAAVVGATRRAGTGRLAESVQRGLRELAMPRAEIVVSVGDDDPGDDVTFLLAANPGSPPLPLTKVASGGELARTMLALRLVLIEAPGTLVFDEVDAGIGGSAATAVGAALAQLATTHQVFVVTHLAQVAAMADHQVLVTKQVSPAGRGAGAGEVTVARATVLDGDDRVAEIARMLSGSPDSPAAREHAAELLAARGRRTGRRR
ncbi:MAG: DNA repair protein RecN [Actinobacteria bacterium]|jgi:DNA repair protein RecN (Recombination protein N)|uniref:DNA repair protein RecN n=1 Tax=freshwater metagenome TaxID=449393 RepID=A0A6J6FFL4_9ZZZZ|nr:DNA repair protein RecN [Actinomycetota bacterium]